MKSKKAEESSDSGIDRIDRKILQLLQRDGRMTNADLAAAVHVSPATCHRRTQRLVEDGYVRGIRAELAPEKLDRSALVIVGVVLDRSTPESFRAFELAIRKLRFVLDCHLVAGDFDFFLKVRVRDISDFNKLHGDQLISLPGVRQTRTFFVMKEVVDNAPLDFYCASVRGPSSNGSVSGGLNRSRECTTYTREVIWVTLPDMVRTLPWCRFGGVPRNPFAGEIEMRALLAIATLLLMSGAAQAQYTIEYD